MKKKHMIFYFLLIWGVGAICYGGNYMSEPRILPVLDLVNDEAKEINLEWYRIPYQNLELRNPEEYPISLTLDEHVLKVEAKEEQSEFLGAVSLHTEDERFDLVINKSYVPAVTFYYVPGDTEDLPEQVYLVGDFNGWNQHADPLRYDGEEERFMREIYLQPGRYSYKFVVDGNWLHDTQNPERQPDGYGGYNSIIQVDGRKRMQGSLIPRSLHDNTVIFEKTRFSPAWKKLQCVVILDNYLMEEMSVEKSGKKTVSFTLPKDLAGKRLLRLVFHDGDHSVRPEVFNFQLGKGLNYDPEFDWRRGVMYYAVTDRFYDGNPDNNKPVEDEELHLRANFKGGDFEGIQKKIKEGYFEELGINILWISPILQNPWEAYHDSLPPHHKFTGYHGYWPIKPRTVEERYGGQKALKNMIKTAHHHDIKVLVDFVASHVHKKHPYYQNHPEWFGTYELPDGRKNIRLFDEFPMSTWFDTFLPSFDYDESPEAVKQMVSDALWHLERFGFDGFRQDAVKHIPHHFWQELTAAMRELEMKSGRHFYQIGETIDSRQKIKDYVHYGEMDGQFDFPLYWTIRDAFAWENMPLSELARSVKLSREAYGYDSLMGVFLGNHDFPRFIAYCDFITPQLAQRDKELFWEDPDRELENPQAAYEKMRNAFGFLFTLNGIPLIYYGDEIGLMGMHDPDNRRMMPFEWDSLQKEMFDWVRSLIQVRRDNPALWLGEFTPVKQKNDLLIYRKDYFDNHVLVIINRFEESRAVEIPVPVKRMKNLLGDEVRDIDTTPFSINVQPRQPMIFHVTYEKSK